MRQGLLRLSTVALTAVLVAVGGFASPGAAATAEPAPSKLVRAYSSYWTQAVAETADSRVIDGGFTKTYGWAVPNDEARVSHTPSTTPSMLGFDINHFFDKPFMRAVFTFEGGIPGYRFQYVSRAEARGCSGANLAGTRFLRIAFVPAINAGQGPVGEILLVQDGAVVTMALVCDTNNRAKFGFGLTAKVQVRTSERSEVDPDGNQRYLVALDFRDS